ncbi:hypothetical protein [Gynuella sp.]|uniref:hypothetical protein n=1 Tax=Gynuella sp. TaxID=2969146 RepID=UPI003D1355EE
MNALLKRLPALMLLIGAITIMQSHAIEFWSQYTGKLGVVWSLMLEGAALWLWAQRSISRNLMALVASALVLTGPLYQVSAPAIAQWQQSTAQPELLHKREQQLQDQRATLTANLATYNANSESRIGWAGRIDDANQALASVNDQLHALYAEQAHTTPMPWQSLAVIVMQALALMLFQILIVLCIRAITAPVPKSSQQQQQPLAATGTAVDRAIQVVKHNAKAKKSQSAAA